MDQSLKFNLEENPNSSIKKVTTIKLSPQTRDRLKDLGVKGQTYEEIVKYLLEKHK